jgi:hypothetical protein
MDAKSFFDTSEERKQVYLLLVHLKDQKQDDIDFTDTGGKYSCLSRSFAKKR